MNASNIYYTDCPMQERQDATEMQGKAFKNLIHKIIREYGTSSNGSFSVDVEKLALSDRKLVNSYYESPEWCEWANESPERVDGLFMEHSGHFQKLADEECDQVYRDAMEEMGMYSWQHRDNGEISWSRR